jgi:hypothetical protein
MDATDIFEYDMPDLPKKYKNYFYSEWAIKADIAETEEEYRKYDKMHCDAKDADPKIEALSTYDGAMALIHATLEYALRK